MDAPIGFGELALIYNDKRSATIIANDACSVYSLEGSLFKSMVVMSSMQRRTQQASFLNSIKLFDSLDKQQKLKLVDGLECLKFEPNQTIFKEGDIGAEFFIIEEGSVRCLKEETQEVIRNLGVGDHFGELALINNASRSLSVVANEKTVLLMLEREAFIRILGAIEQHLNMDYKK
jgi:cAMP-dependent protein kinase regulator